MNTPRHSTPLLVDTLWHTNWGFAVKQIIDEKPYNYFFWNQVAWSHRDYAERFILPWQRREHEFETRTREGTPSPLLPDTTAYVCAQIASNLINFPLDPVAAQRVLYDVWTEYIQKARAESRPALEIQRDERHREIQRVIDGDIPTVLALRWIIGICCEMRHGENNISHT